MHMGNRSISVPLEEFRDILSRFQSGFPAYIACDEGWNQIIIKCHRELSIIDPGYTIAQIKEKFGGLRYYFATTNPALYGQMREVASRYELMSFETCEVCGKKGALVSGRVLKTVCKKHAGHAGIKS